MFFIQNVCAVQLGRWEYPIEFLAFVMITLVLLIILDIVIDKYNDRKKIDDDFPDQSNDHEAT